MSTSTAQAEAASAATAAGNAAAAATAASVADWPAIVDLDRPLPDALTGRGQGWLTRYRRWPVFSAAWQRGRLRPFGFWLALAMLPLLISTLNAPQGLRPWGGLLTIVLEMALPLLLGPWLALQVRRRAGGTAREWPLLCAAVGAAVLATLAFHLLLAEPLKQWVAERTGQVDAQGRRSTSAVVIGINVVPPKAAADAPRAAGARPGPDAAPAPADGGPDMASERWVGAFNLGVRGLLAFWLAGGAGLWAWRRERAGLLAVQRERELTQAQAQRREAELRLSVLAAQVEPHFLFNTLAGVRSAIATDPARASDMVDHLVDYLRASIPRLRSNGAALATLGGQFDSVRAYLALMAARMPRLHFELHAEPGLLQAHCPPLMLISLAENAVKHGVEPKIGPAHIAVHAERTPDGALAIRVSDDGVGFGQAGSGTGIGLDNIRQRLAALYGDRATLALRARPEGGVEATLTLPLEFDNPA